MEQVSIKNLTVRIADGINHVWVILDEQVNRETFAESLGDADFSALLQQHQTKNVLIDCTRMWSFGIPEMSDYLDTKLTASMRPIGVQKISVVVSDEAMSYLALIFQGIEVKHNDSTPKIRFFGASQFYESFDSVSWFE